VTEFFSGTNVVDFIIVCTLIEWLVLWLVYRRTGRGIAPATLRMTLLPGLYLMMALRCALTALPFYVVLLFLIASGLTHAADLMRRWNT
jgi:hypothetical protein